MIVIKKCTCTHAFQDKQFGLGKRAHNLCVKDGSNKGLRCTVCGNAKGAQKGEIDRKRKGNDESY